MKNLHRVLFGLIVTASLGLPGCGNSGGLEKVTVEGAVTFDGQPITNGEIQFHPTEGTMGPVSGAPIVDGRYRVEAKGGVPVGKHIVRIEAYGGSGGGSSDEMITSGRSPGGRTNYLPPKYHHHSQLTLDVTGDRSVMTHDFHLTK